MWLQLDGALAHFNILFISRKIKYTSLNVLNKYFAYFANVCQWIYLLPCLSSFFVIKLSKDDLLGRKRRRSSLTSTPLPPRSSPPFLWKRIEPYQRWSSSLAWDFSPIRSSGQSAQCPMSNFLHYYVYGREIYDDFQGRGWACPNCGSNANTCQPL